MELKPEKIYYTNTDQCLRSVGQHTIDVLHLSDVHMPENKIMSEIVFDKEARVAKLFEAVVKCLRLKNPNVIKLQKKGLTDVHIKQLVAHLSGRNQIYSLDLRRNCITNKSVFLLAEWI